MSAYQTDPRVDSYISALPSWQQDICRRVRELAHAADPGVVMSASGQIDLGERTFHTPDLRVVIVTTSAGEGRLRGRFRSTRETP